MNEIDYKDEAKALLRELIISLHHEGNETDEYNVNRIAEFLKEFEKKIKNDSTLSTV